MKCRRCRKNKPYNGDWYDGMCPECADATEPKETSELLCEHANEVPAVCPCPKSCACKKGTCSKRKAKPKVVAPAQTQVFIQVLGGVVQSIHVRGTMPEFFVLDFDNEDEDRCENLTKAEVIADQLIKKKKVFKPADWDVEDGFVKRFE